ncbi:MAG: tRNA threonylcarbamoyladenosine biosynthesis protein TsaE [Patescibacteria group bacterium]|jgi:tRNA threonylcarbamoyladenosine biosynthesis protein TsaE|nr:tRNA threonylcarbamoyladenosine biosynthesis protein TsaE [Patescibacteria group bacterium]
MKEGQKFTSKTTTETAEIAKKILEIIEKQEVTGAFVLALSGELGAGKTTLSQEIGKILEVKETMQSPTFVIMKSYDTSHSIFKKLVHIDAYRIEKEEELKVLKLEELFKDKSVLVVIEWPENIKQIIPKDVLRVSIKHKSENEREFEIFN